MANQKKENSSKKNPCKVITGVVRFSYLYATMPHASDETQTPKYSVSLIIPKTDTETVNAINAAVEAAISEGKSKLCGKGKTLPPRQLLKLPLRDGDLERDDDPVYAGAFFLNASSPNKPGIVGADCKPIMDESEIYSGMYGRASITFFAFNKSGNRGIAAGLNNLMKCRDGERLAGGASAEEDFAEFAEETADESTASAADDQVLSDGEPPF